MARRRRIPRLRPWQLLLLPAAVLIALFYLLPAVVNLVLAFSDMDYTFDYHFVGGASLVRPLADPMFGVVLRNTAVYVVTTLTLMNVVAALVLAILTTEVPERVGSVFRVLWLLPRATPSVVYVLMWFFLLDPTDYGLVNRVAGSLGGSNYDLLTSHPWAVVVLMNGCVGASMGMVVFTAAIKSIPPQLIMAARVDGATAWQRIRHVTLPAIAWPVMFVTVYQTLSLLTSYEYILLSTDGGPFYQTEVLSLYVFHNAIADYELGYGAALSIGLMAIGTLVALIYWRVFGLGARSLPARIEVDR
ncbi:MAG TPA: sugar ABC transporter permease [Kofleriaceae bacterium]|nr:sugar ABC transporter permease [Kofleriaceae bacterium]